MRCRFGERFGGNRLTPSSLYQSFSLSLSLFFSRLHLVELAVRTTRIYRPSLQAADFSAGYLHRCSTTAESGFPFN